MPELFIDIETFANTDLKKSGVYRYVEDPSFRILMAAWAIDDGPIKVAFEPQEMAEIPGLYDPDVTKVAHNANFERICFTKLAHRMGLVPPEPGRYLPPEEWHDTQAIAAERGYPQGLGWLAPALGAEEKEEAGTRLINLFSKPQRGRRVLPEDRPMEWLEFVEYCVQDVATLRDVHRRLGGWPTEMERRIYLADQRINDNGIVIDLDMVRLARSNADRNAEQHREEVRRLTGIDNPSSVQQFTEWANSNGLVLPNLRAETIENVLRREDLEPLHRKVLELRQELALTASKKYDAALSGVCEDGRLRGGFRFYGAHTGRWSGKGVQFQNLPRAQLQAIHDLDEDDPDFHKMADAVTEAPILDLVMGEDLDAHTLKALVRSMFRGPFTVVDYSAIEARVIAWLAGEEWALQAFRDGRDIYVETAERMSKILNIPLTRSQGKVAVLALGYNGGVASLRAMGAEGEDEELQQLVDVWRQANQRIQNFWWDLGRAFEFGDSWAGDRIFVEKHGDDRRIRLPSGRAIEYHNVRPQWKMKFGKKRKVMTFTDPKRNWPIDTYGGKLAENVTQGVARDILAEALVRLHDKGYTVAGHIHDEIVVEGAHDVEVIKKIMTEPPSWADGMPIDGEGFVCQRYRKG